MVRERTEWQRDHSRLGSFRKISFIQRAKKTVMPTAIQAGQGLTKTMVPPSEEAAIETDLPEVMPDFDELYLNFYKVIRTNAEPIVKNEEVYQVLELIEVIFAAAESQTIIRWDTK